VVIIEAAVVLGLVGLGLYWTFRLLMRSPDQRRLAARSGRWQINHYDVKGATRVVVQKVSDASVLDEHVVATIPIDDPEYDAKFLAATSAARERRALFETEQE
jgi:hypothetical protein